MTRRFPDMTRPRPHVTAGEVISVWTAALAGVCVVIITALFFLTFIPKSARAHESWVNSGAYKNTSGEWCCGDYDCKTYRKASSSAEGWMIDGELVPYDEAMPVIPPDGQVTICRRPDGTRRCVFGIKPGT